MATTETLHGELEERRKASRELEAKAEEAARLAGQVEDLRKDLARLEERRDKFAALGKGHVEQRLKTWDPRYKAEIEWQPMLSLKTGDELAAGVESECAYLRGQIAEREAEIERLLT